MKFHTTSLGALCGLFLLPTLAFADPGFPGEWDLEGRYSTRSPTEVSLQVTRLPDGGTVVSRTGKYTSRRFSHLPEFTWSSSDVRINGRRMQVTYRLGDDAEAIRGLVDRFDPDAADRDDVLAALQRGNELRAVYFVSSDGNKLREFVVNNSRQRPEHWWSWVQTSGERVQPAASTTLTAAEFEAKARQTMFDWYLEDVREYYESELADTSLTADERRRLEESRDIDMDTDNLEVYDQDDYWNDAVRERYEYDNDPYQDANGNAIPQSAVEVRGLSMYPEYAGIGLSKTWVFDSRTGDVLEEGDIQD
jgi:hypothetical protein